MPFPCAVTYVTLREHAADVKATKAQTSPPDGRPARDSIVEEAEWMSHDQSQQHERKHTFEVSSVRPAGAHI